MTVRQIIIVSYGIGIREMLIASGRSAEDVRVREVNEELRSIDEAEKYY